MNDRQDLVEIVAGVLHDAFKGDTDVDCDRLAAVIVDRLPTMTFPTFTRDSF